MSFLLICSLDCRFQIPKVIQAVEDTDDINTVCDGLLNEILNHII